MAGHSSISLSANNNNWVLRGEEEAEGGGRGISYFSVVVIIVRGFIKLKTVKCVDGDDTV